MTLGGTLNFKVSVGTAPTTDQSSVTYNGVTFTFNKAMPVGEFVTGEPFVVSDEAFEITSITPASSDINADGSVGHGTMKDPYITSSTADLYSGSLAYEQGFDDYLGVNNASYIATAVTPYNSSLNIDPGNTASNISVSLGENSTYVKSVRLSSVTDGDQWQTIEKYVPLTVLSEAPAANPFRPTMTGTTKTIYTTADLDLSVFRSITLPASFTDTLSSIEASIPDDSGQFGANGTTLRRFRLDVEAGTTTSNYSAEIADQYAKACILLHSDAYTDAEKQDLLYKLITWGIQFEGMYDRGWRGIGDWMDGAGQHGAFAPIFYTAAFALGSSTMLAKAQAIYQPFNNIRWVTSEFLSITPGTNTGNMAQPFISENIGVPMRAETTDVGSNWSTRYGPIADFIIGWEGAATILLRNGPSGETGFSARNDGAFDTTNDKSAVWGYLDRRVTLDPSPATTSDLGAAWSDLWSDIQSLGIYTPWTGVPDQLHAAAGDPFTAGDGQISWDISAYDYATETVTQTDFRYSIDGVQYVEVSDVSASDNQTGLLKGVDHYVGLRLTSASGNGPWSQNWPLFENTSTHVDSDRLNTVTTTGTASATVPTFTTTPAIHTLLGIPNPSWDENYMWTPAGSTLGGVDSIVAAGSGYVDGEADPSFTYQWKRDAVDISGETSKEYTISPWDDRGATITCEVTPSNSAGTGTAATTAGATVYNFPVLRSDYGYEVNGDRTSISETVAIGEADADRWLAVVIMGNYKYGRPTSVTIGGQSCSIVDESYVAATWQGFAQIWITDAKVPSGTTATLEWTSAGAVASHRVEIVPIYASSLIAHDTATTHFAGSAGSGDISIDIPTNGVMIAGAGWSSGSGGASIAFGANDNIATFMSTSGTIGAGANPFRFGIQYFDGAVTGYEFDVRSNRTTGTVGAVVASFSTPEAS